MTSPHMNNTILKQQSNIVNMKEAAVDAGLTATRGEGRHLKFAPKKCDLRPCLPSPLTATRLSSVLHLVITLREEGAGGRQVGKSTLSLRSFTGLVTLDGNQALVSVLHLVINL